MALNPTAGTGDWAVAYIKPQYFWKHVVKTATGLGSSSTTATGCWLWTGRVHHGYGRHFIWVGKTVSILPHRASYILAGGILSPGMELHFNCGNTLCVNPDHLEPKTPKENTALASDRHMAKQNMRKTHCPQGHPYSQTNNRGHRVCILCHQQANARYGERRTLRRRTA